MVAMIPDTTPQQQLRIRRFWMAAGSYAFFVALIVLGQALGTVSLTLPATGLLIAAVALVNLVIYLVFVFGLNLRFRDKSLTMLQMTVGILVITTTIFFIDTVRGAFLLLYVACFSFGLFRLRVTQFLLLTVLIITGYGTVVALLTVHRPEQVALGVELVQVLVLSALFVWFSFLGGYINRLRERVEELAVRDELTTLVNRRELFNILDREVEQARREGDPISVLIVDVDDFKSVNDRWGHLVGDHVLREVARALVRGVRRGDVVGRYGGEEFLVILSDPEIEGALACGERLRHSVEHLGIETGGTRLSVTISVGATTYVPPEPLNATLARADSALYEAKAAGKNRVAAGRLSDPAGDAPPGLLERPVREA